MLSKFLHALMATEICGSTVSLKYVFVFTFTIRDFSTPAPIPIQSDVDEDGRRPTFRREVELYDEAADLLRRRFDPCWISSWGKAFLALAVIFVVLAIALNLWFLVMEPHFYGELRAPDHRLAGFGSPPNA